MLSTFAFLKDLEMVCYWQLPSEFPNNAFHLFSFWCMIIIAGEWNVCTEVRNYTVEQWVCLFHSFSVSLSGAFPAKGSQVSVPRYPCTQLDISHPLTPHNTPTPTHFPRASGADSWLNPTSHAPVLAQTRRREDWGGGAESDDLCVYVCVYVRVSVGEWDHETFKSHFFPQLFSHTAVGCWHCADGTGILWVVLRSSG